MSIASSAEIIQPGENEISPPISVEDLISQAIGASKHVEAVHKDYQPQLIKNAIKQSIVTAERKEIEKRMRWETDEDKVLAIDSTQEAIELLIDPNYPLRDFERIVLLAPHRMGEEPTTDARSLQAANTLRAQLLELNEYLENSTESQHFVLLTYKPSTFPGWLKKLYVTYGLTQPGHGLPAIKA